MIAGETTGYDRLTGARSNAYLQQWITAHYPATLIEGTAFSLVSIAVEVSTAPEESTGQALAAIGRMLEEHVAADGMVAYLEDGQFAVALADYRHESWAVGEHLCRQVMLNAAALVTLEMGVVVIPDDQLTPDELTNWPARARENTIILSRDGDGIKLQTRRRRRSRR